MPGWLHLTGVLSVCSLHSITGVYAISSCTALWPICQYGYTRQHGVVVVLAHGTGYATSHCGMGVRIHGM